MIADRLCLMRLGKQLKNDEDRKRLATEVSYLYAPLAHRLGLYTIKSELEDLSLKYTDRKQYDFIKQKLNETKRSRDAYIAEFITPIKSKLEEAGLQFDIKGRTKSIHSINNKLKKQNIPFEDIYDLFAIRIILDTPYEKERSDCWQVYSIITDMYQPNPKRHEGLDIYPENERLRKSAYHRDGTTEQMGGSADPYPPHGRNCRTGTGRSLEI